MPEITVWPVSSSVRTWKVGSSSDSAWRALPIFSWSTLVLGSTATWMTGSGELELLEHDLAARGRQRVAGAGVLEADAGGDVAGEDGVDVLAVVGVHLQDAADALLGARGRVDDLGALLERARVHPEVGELADVGVGHDLERQRRERLVVGRLALDLLVALEGQAGDRGEVERAGQVVDDGVEQRLHALVLEGGAVEDRDDLVGDRAGADGARRSSTVISSSPTYFSRMFSSKVDRTSMSWWRYSSASALRSSGISGPPTWRRAPRRATPAPSW